MIAVTLSVTVKGFIDDERPKRKKRVTRIATRFFISVCYARIV